ncbi:MAG: XRE family transcriptional regulator [Bacteroidia bacterium]|nr:XRE family transcriptional regulator [Bacteroidia bacterium]
MNTEKIGSFLSALRRAKGLTQQELADIFHVSNKTISKWECGDSLPDISTLLAIAEYYEVTIDELFAGERKEAKKEVASDTEQRNRRARTNYYYSKRLNQLKIFSIISYAMLLISITLVLVFIATYRYALAFGLGTALLIISIGLFVIGVLTSRNNASEELDDTNLQKLNLLVYKVVYIFVSIILLASLVILVLQNIDLLISMSIFVLAVIASPLYYYVLKRKWFGIRLPVTLEWFVKWIGIIRPVYLIVTIATLTYLLITPLYQIVHYSGVSPVPVEAIDGTFFNVIRANPTAVGLYFYMGLFVIAIGLAIFSYIRQKTMFLSYVLQAIATFGVYTVIYQQYAVDLSYFEDKYDTVSSTTSSISFLAYALIIFSVAHLGHAIIGMIIAKRKAKIESKTN